MTSISVATTISSCALTYLVEVSSDGGTSYSSSGTTYSELISTANTVLAFGLAPATSAFDSGTTDRTRKVRVTVQSPYST